MGSLLKVNNKEDFMDWAKDKGDEFYLSEKYDGSTVVATYKNGQLMSLATRGDGKVGENITQNNLQMIGAPPILMHIPDGPNRFSGEIRGEAMILLDDFEKNFRPIEGRYKNPLTTYRC